MTAANETGADESFSHPAPATLWANGVRILFVYPAGSDARKQVTKAYWDACIAAGIAMVLINEHGNQQMLVGGFGFGGQLARESVGYAQTLGVTAGDDRPQYYVAEDPNPVPAAQWPIIVDRFREVCAHHLAAGWVLPGDTVGNSLVGAYGSGPLLEHLYTVGVVGHVAVGTRGNDHDYGWLWPVGTWGPCPHAAFWQDPNTRLTTLAGEIDRDYVAAGVVDVGQYPAPHFTGPPQPAAKPAERNKHMYVVNITDRSSWGVITAEGTKFHIATPAAISSFTAFSGQPAQQIVGADWDMIGWAPGAAQVA